jgi:hypothetical protein
LHRRILREEIEAMKTNRRTRPGFGFAATALCAIVSFGFGPLALAQDDAADPPTRVGRIAFIEGNVSFHPSPDDPWAAASINYPIAQAGQIYADPQSRAEIGLGEARIQIAGGTEVDIVQLDEQNVVVSVPQGRIDLYLRNRHPEEHYFVETPRGNVEIAEDGRYRVVAGTADEPTRIATFGGRAAIAETEAQLTINRGEEAVISPTDPPSFDVATATEDAFDRDGEESERRAIESVSYKYVSPDMPGAAELTQYGEWHTDPDYGAVWVPAGLPVDWAPYRVGHWAFVAPWGYTWIDDAPWGFAPFHYGRWAQVGGAWAWIPGEVVVHPVYAPALVTFVGDPAALIGGAAIGVSIGWIPLGPREVWVPPYHVSIDYIRHGNVAYVPATVVNNITVNNITVIHEKTVFVNQQHVTVVPQQAFANAQPIQRAAVKIEPAVLTRPIVAAAAPARVLPPPAPAARLEVPTRQVAPPPAASVPIAHPIAPTNNLPKLAPAPATAVKAPAPAALPKPPAAPAGIRPPEPAPAARPGVPATPAAPAPARLPEPQQARPAAPTPPPAPQARPAVPPAPAPQARPATPPAPAPQARPAAPPAPAPQARPAAPPAPAPQARPAPPPPAAPAARPAPPAPAPQQARPPQPPAPAARPAPPPAPARPATPPPAPQARPQAPAPQAHPPAPQGQPPKKDDKNEKKPNDQQH